MHLPLLYMELTRLAQNIKEVKHLQKQSVRLIYPGKKTMTKPTKAQTIEALKGSIAKWSAVPVVDKGNDCALIKFSGNAKSTDESYGHDEYVSMSEGARFLRVFSKIVYIAKHSKNEQAKALFAQLPNPVEFVVGQDGNPITFTTNEELVEIKNVNGEDVTFIWAEDDNNTRIAIRFTNPKEYIAQLITALQGFVGDIFYLELKMDKERGFQRLVSINQPKLA